MLESSFRRGGSPSALRLEKRRVVSNLGVGSSGPSSLGGEGGAVAEVPVYPPIAQLHSTAPQLHSSGEGHSEEWRFEFSRPNSH